jgi:GH24 family phage-related lysozyme (muramidase)
MKLKNILLSLPILFIMLVTTSLGQVGDEFQDKTKYPDIVAPSKDPAIQKLYERLKLFDCVSGSDFGTTYDSADTGAVINFQKINGLNTTGEVHADTWKALSLTTWGTMSGGATSSKKCPAPTQTNNTSVTPSNADPTQASEDYYTNVSSFDGSSASTKFSNTTTGSISIVFNYLLTLMAVAIVVLVIFRVLQGAVIKGTFDNIYNQMKGKSMISNAGKALLVFIIVYAILAFINPDLVNWTMDTSYKADLSKSPYNNTNGSCPTDPYGEKSLREMIIFNEGKTNYVFLDTATPPLPSIGVGFNLKRNGAKESLIKAGVSEVKATQLVNATKEDKSLTLDDATIFKLLDEDIQVKKKEAVNYFKKDNIDFNSLPQNVQNVIIDMMFNIGIAGFDKFTDMKKGLKTKDWAEASRQIIDSNYCSQVKSRCYRNAALMSPGCGGALNNTNTSGQSLAGVKANVGNRCAAVPKTQLVEVGIKKTGGCVPAGPIYLRQDVAKKFKEMQAAALSEAGIKLEAAVGYRDSEQQLCIWKQNGCGATQKSCRVITAIPCSMGGGGSNHTAGVAIDLTNASIGECTAKGSCNTKEFLWLKNNGGRWGFYNYLKDDNIHWSITGR